MTLPPGWINNMVAPELLMPTYEGDQTPGWRAAPGSQHGAQPKSANNPDGNIPGVPIMALDGDSLGYLVGPPPQGSPKSAGDHKIKGQ